MFLRLSKRLYLGRGRANTVFSRWPNRVRVSVPSRSFSAVLPPIKSRSDPAAKTLRRRGAFIITVLGGGEGAGVRRGFETKEKKAHTRAHVERKRYAHAAAADARQGDRRRPPENRLVARRVPPPTSERRARAAAVKPRVPSCDFLVHQCAFVSCIGAFVSCVLFASRQHRHFRLRKTCPGSSSFRDRESEYIDFKTQGGRIFTPGRSDASPGDQTVGMNADASLSFHVRPFLSRITIRLLLRCSTKSTVRHGDGLQRGLRRKIENTRETISTTEKQTM